MKYEIINPSDKCFVSGDDEKVVAAAVIILGSGRYGCRSAEGNSLPTMFIFSKEGDADRVWKETFGVSFTDYMTTPGISSKLSLCLATFEYADKPTSINEIWRYAKKLENAFKVQAEAGNIKDVK